MDYIKVNEKSWSDRVDTHLASAFYDLEGFKAGKNSLNSIELELLSDVQGKSIVHLQCHFGQDSMSLSRMGALVTGVDFSTKAIATAKKLSSELGLNTQFIESDILSLSDKQIGKYDIIFTSYGTVGWLPDLDKWAETISSILKPNGKFIMVDFHPAVWMFDDDMKEVKYRYFKSEPIIETQEKSYTDGEEKLDLKTISWNHGMSEIIQPLLNNGLKLAHFAEHDYSPYNCFPNMEKIGERMYRHKVHTDKLPYIYSLVFNK